MQDVIYFVNNNLLLCTAWISVLVLLILVEIKERKFGPVSLGITQLTSLINNEDATVIDIRANSEFNGGHITQAEHFNFSSVNDADVLYKRLEAKKDQPIILVCKDGMQSKQLAFKLQGKGLTKISFLNGGMATWRSEGMPTVS